MEKWFVFTARRLQFGASQVVLEIKNPPANVGDKKFRFDPWIGKESLE